MPGTVRSVKVRLEADVAKYIADMQAAAAATRAAFDGRNLGGSNSNSGVQQQERAVQSLTDRTRNLSAANRDARRELDQFRSSTASMRSEVDRLAASLRGVGPATDRSTTSTRRLGNEIDRTSGRMGVLLDTAVTLGPALLPLGASLTPVLTGATAGLAAAATGAGVLLLAFHGVGDAAKALNAYQLKPTTENLHKLQQAMDDLGPSGAKFVEYIDSLTPQLDKLQQLAGRSGLFSGMEDGIGSLMTMLPTVSQIVARVSAELGRLASQGGASLANDSDWQAFFQYLKTDAAPTLDAFARSIGNFAAGIGSMIRGFAPLSRGFADGLLHMSRNFRTWAADTSNFQGFIDYVQRVGPQAREFFSALVDAVSGLAQAMAPWGSAVLPILTNVTSLFAALAKSPVGPILFTAAAGMLAFNRATAIANSGAVTRLRTGLSGLNSNLRTLPRAASEAAAGYTAGMVRMGNVTEEQAARIQASNTRLQRVLNSSALRGGALIGGTLLAGSALTTSSKTKGTLAGAGAGALIGTSIDPGLGTAIGAGVGALAGFVSSLHNASAASDDLAADWSGLGATLTASGKTTASTLADIASQFSKTGTLAAGQKYGLTPEQIVGAVTGPKSQYNATLSQLGSGIMSKDFSGNKVQDLAYLPKGVKSTDQYKDFKADVDKARAALGLETAAQKAANEAANESVGAYQSAAASLKSYIDQQNQLHQATLANIDKQTAFGQALHDAQVQARKGTDGFSAFTEAGRANRNAMSSLIGAYNDQSQAVKNSVKGYRDIKAEVVSLGHQMHLSKAVIDALTASIDKPKKLEIRDEEAQQRVRAIQRLVNTYGLTKAQARALLDDNASGKIHSVQQLVDKYGLSKKTATALLNDLASGKLHSIIGLINSLHNKTVTVRLNHITENSVITHYSNTFSGSSNNPPNRTPGAMGMILRGDRKVFARGGVDKANAHEAEVAPGGTPYRIWAEPETQGEAYIPFANDHRRPRARRILEYTAKQLGGDVTWLANGGIVQRFTSGGYAQASQGGSSAPGSRNGVAHASSGASNMQIVRLTDAVKTLTHSVDHAKNQVQKWTDKQTQLESTVRSSLTLDAFSSDASPWTSRFAAGSRGAFRATEHTQIANAHRLAKDIARLRRDGASDEFISYILSQQDPVSVAHMFASETKAQVRSDSRLYGAATRAVNVTANAGGAIYNNEVRESNRILRQEVAELKAANKHLKELKAQEKKHHGEAQDTRKHQPHETAKAINGTASAGKLRGVKHPAARFRGN